MSDGRPNTDDLLGVGADWLDGQTVDEVIDELRGAFDAEEARILTDGGRWEEA